MKQIKVAYLNQAKDDLFVANVARVSFNKWKTAFDEKDQKLLNYLAREHHSSPFRHVRQAFSLSTSFDLSVFKDLSPFESAGLVQKETGDRLIVKHSVYGWANLIRKMAEGDLKSTLCSQMYSLFPGCSLALGLAQADNHEEMVDSDKVTPLTEKEANQYGAWFTDLSFRCAVPIWLSRQLVKHQTTLSWNEVSRRYVDSPLELFDQELRERPTGGIKQGSGAVIAMEKAPTLNIGGKMHTIDSVMESLLDWYDRCVEAELAPETIRGFMPLNMMTEYVWSGSLPAFAHMHILRADGHAQKEAQDFAIKLYDQIPEDIRNSSWQQAAQFSPVSQ